MILSVTLAATLGALLIATIYFTRFDLQWLAFLGGILFAAVLALVSQASKAEWLLLRRSKQLERVREQLDRETARGRNATQGLHAAETRLRLVSDRLSIPFLYIDRDERCHYHNQACAEWLGLPAENIDGRLLHDVFGSKAYQLIAPQVALTLSGETVDYEVTWRDRSGASVALKARQFPYAPDAGQVIGLYLMLTRSVLEPTPAEKAAESTGAALLVSGDSSEKLYVQSITEELMIGRDPRSKFAQALQQDEFLLFVQKILPLKSGLSEPDCYEVLLRLQEEEDHLLPPGGFIPVAEHYGMLEEIDRWVVHSLITWCLNKRKSFPGWRVPLYCINLSGASVNSPEFVKFVRRELESRDFPARALCFEISQPDVINHNDGVRRFIADLKPAGCRFSIDDFGSAKVSFSHLKGFAIDFLKIDGSIVQNIVRDPAELAKTRAINTVCQKSGTRTVAELVETKETLDKLREIGVDYAQGFGIARPALISTVA